MEFKGVIFDFNGTLFYDTPFHNIAWSRMVQELTGHEIDQDLKVKMHGKNNRDILKCIDMHLSEEMLEMYSLKKEAYYRSICLEHPEDLHFVKGATQWFDSLKNKGVPFIIASASIKENIDFFFEIFQLDQWFDRNQIVYDNGQYANKSEMFLEASHRLNVDLKDCIVVEDSVTGISQAKKAKAGYIIGIAPQSKHQELLDLGADVCRENFEDINDLF